MKLATFAQAVSELSNTVHVNISNKIAHLQQDISQLERMLQRSLQSGYFLLRLPFACLLVCIYIYTCSYMYMYLTPMISCKVGST